MPNGGHEPRQNAGMRRSVTLFIAALVVSVAGAAWIARGELAERRAAFETDARIAHRLLSQRVAQHDAILATLALLQPGNAGEAAPEQRLPALYPQVQRVLRRDRGTDWTGPDAAALRAGEAASRQAGRAAIAAVDLAAGRYTLVLAAEPSSFALQIHFDTLVPASEWTLPRDGATRALLVHGGQQRVLAPGHVDGPGWRFDFSKHLSADSQPFDLQAQLRVGWDSLPWAAMLLWTVLVVAAVAAVGGWQRQRAQRRRAEELLRLGQVGRLNALGELAAGMAHELNQPLTAVLANTQAASRLLAEDEPELDTARGAMAQAVQQAKRANDVVTRLRRAVERPDIGAHVQPLRLDEALRNALDLLEPECRRLGVAPSVSCEPAALVVRAEPVALEQIVHNLLSNALHALAQVPAGTRQLALRAGVDGSDATKGVLAVRDSGPGIAPEALPRLFEPFFSTRSGGLGLGLSLCETLAAGMGGALSARNVAPHGAEFRLALPLVEGPA
jgi:signal transduction histidine kinase